MNSRRTPNRLLRYWATLRVKIACRNKAGNSVFLVLVFCFNFVLVFADFYSAPAGERSIAISFSVNLSVREHICGTAGPIFTNFLCRSPVAVARSSSGGIAIRYVLPVLWMTLRLTVVGFRGGGHGPPWLRPWSEVCSVLYHCRTRKQATTSAATTHFRTRDTPMIGSTGNFTCLTSYYVILSSTTAVYFSCKDVRVL